MSVYVYQTLHTLFFCSVPVLLVWFYYLNRKHETDKRTEILLAALEKKPDMDVEEFMKKLNMNEKPHKRISLKIKVMVWQILGIVLLAGGIPVLGIAVGMDINGHFNSDGLAFLYMLGAFLTILGAIFLLVYYQSKKFLSKELALEEAQLDRELQKVKESKEVSE